MILFLALRHGHVISRLFAADHSESLLLGVLGLPMLVAGIAQGVSVSAAVGAFLVAIALSGRVAHNAQQLLSPLRARFAAIFFVFFGLSTEPTSIPPVLLPAAILALITSATKIFTGYRAAVGIGFPGDGAPGSRSPARRVFGRHRRPRGRLGNRAAARTARDGLPTADGDCRPDPGPNDGCGLVPSPVSNRQEKFRAIGAG